MSEQFSILIDSRTRFETSEPGGVWLSMPTTKEQLHEAMRSVGITADNPQDFSIRGYSDDPDNHIALPYEMVCSADVDELNFLAARLHQLTPAEIGELNAAAQRQNGFENIGQIIDYGNRVACCKGSYGSGDYQSLCHNRHTIKAETLFYLARHRQLYGFLVFVFLKKFHK